ncbi:uncharacterized protein [Procambarus clarkii]|uniref:uncharacterized protein isoform X2 n=1 Tax=Procambarus clarkii TaxID=6728 RepID=UPI00374389E4
MVQEYSIDTTWNGGPLDHTPVQVSLSGSADQQYLEVSITAPFFNDPPAPPGPPGQPFYGLWDYEVVEVFFLNDQDQYVEVEVCPWGQHIVLLLNGKRETIRHSLPLEVTTQRNNDTGIWTGLARIPVTYLPHKVSKFNAYAIHGSGEARVYEALYPAPATATDPDFHALQYFQPINLTQLLPDQADAPISQLWTDSLEGVFRYSITTTWDDVPLAGQPVQFTLQGFQAGVEINVTAPFYNDPAPDGPSGQPFYGLWDYEVVEMFFLNDEDEYLEVELGPWGQHLLLLLKGERNTIKHSLPLDYIVLEKTDPVGDTPGEWRGSAMIPPGYFPPNVTRMNAYAIHGVGDSRQYQALYPAPHGDPDYPQPDFHKLSLFRPIDFEFQVADNSEYSDVWLEAINSGSTTLSPEFKTEETVEPVTVLSLIITTEPTPAPTSKPTPAPTTEPKPSPVAEPTPFPVTEPPPAPTTTTQEDGKPEGVARLGLVQKVRGRRPQPLRVPSTPFRDQRLANENRDTELTSVGNRRTTQLVPSPQRAGPSRGQLERRRLQQSVLPPGQSLTGQEQQFSDPNIQQPEDRIFQDQRRGQESLQLQNQRVQQQGQQFQDQRFQEETSSKQDQRFQDQRFQQQDQRFQEETSSKQDQRFQDQRFQQHDQGFQQQDQRFQQQDQGFQQHEQGFQQHEQGFQQQDQGFQQQDQRFQQQDQGFQQQDQRFQQQDQGFQQQVPQFQDPTFQQESVHLPDSVASSATIPEAETKVEVTIPDVEAAVEALVEQTAALPPPHPVCFEPGLVPDEQRCYAFHECVLENGAWQVYSWRCRRGHMYDPVTVACVRGRCRRRG